MATDDDHRVVCHLDRLLSERSMTLTELADRVGVTVVNLSVLKNNRARAVRFSTLAAICDALRCQPGNLFSVTTADDQTDLTAATSLASESFASPNSSVVRGS
jgi:putative transcriptional regulator